MSESMRKVTIDSLPEELIAETFMLCLPQDKFTTYHRSSAPLLLCGICRKWRNTVLSLPLIWSSICIELLPSGVIFPSLDFVKFWLDRTGSQPLTISFLSHTNGTANDRVMDALIPEFHRWKSFKLLQLKDSVVWKLPETSGSRLEELHISVLALTQDEGQQLTRILGMAPRLHSVTHHIPLSLVFPWRQLKKYHARYPQSTSDCFDIIRQSPLLLDFAIGVFSNDDASMTSHSLTHGLRSWDIWASVALGRMFDLLTLPSLCEIFIETADAPSEFINLLSRSRCPLRKLALCVRETQNESSSEGFLIACLHIVSSTLEELTFSGKTTDQLFVLLTSNDTADNETTSFLCPTLKTLVLKGPILSSDGVLADMVKSRLSHGPAGIHHHPRSDLLEHMDVFWEIREGFLAEDEERLRDMLLDDFTVKRPTTGCQSIRVRWPY